MVTAVAIMAVDTKAASPLKRAVNKPASRIGGSLMMLAVLIRFCVPSLPAILVAWPTN